MPLHICPYDGPYYRRQYYASTRVSGGTSNLCTGTATFNVTNISGATYTWTYSAYLIPSGATNTSSFTVQRNGSSSGTGWVKVQISTPCSGSPVSTQVNFAVGAPAVPDLTINGVAPYGAIDATVTTDEPPPYSWYVDGNFIKTTTDKRTLYDLIPAGTCGEYHSLTVRVDNACGSTTSYPSTYSYSCNSYMVSPNPASSEVTVTTDQTKTTTGKTGTAAITEINIYDQQGFLKKKQKFGQVKRAVVNLDGLSTGVYFIEIVSGTYRERKQLSILR